MGGSSVDPVNIPLPPLSTDINQTPARGLMGSTGTTATPGSAVGPSTSRGAAAGASTGKSFNDSNCVPN